MGAVLAIPANAGRLPEKLTPRQSARLDVLASFVRGGLFERQMIDAERAPTPDERSAFRARREYLDELMRPASKIQTIKLVSELFTRMPAGKDPQKEATTIEDICKEAQAYPEFAIVAACRHWIRTETFKPSSVSKFLKMIDDAVSEFRVERHRLDRVLNAVVKRSATNAEREATLREAARHNPALFSSLG
jgi:hypothetical protein